MSDLLVKTKLAVLDHMKVLPEAPMAKDEDFKVWGMRFCEVLVSRTIIAVFISTKDLVGGVSCLRKGLKGRRQE
jgi:hypothetical protein